jgi:hypothetical protein
MTVAEMRERMSSAEYEAWKEFYAYEDWVHSFQREALRGA